MGACEGVLVGTCESVERKMVGCECVELVLVVERRVVGCEIEELVLVVERRVVGCECVGPGMVVERRMVVCEGVELVMVVGKVMVHCEVGLDCVNTHQGPFQTSGVDQGVITELANKMYAVV